MVECSGRFFRPRRGDRDERQLGNVAEGRRIGPPVSGRADQSEADTVFSHGSSQGAE